MKPDAFVSHEASDDIENTFTWYEERRKGLGHDFLLQIEAAIRLIENNPAISPEKYRNVRQLLIRRFPYKVFYLVEENKIIIIAVLYAGRNPELIKQRMR